MVSALLWVTTPPPIYPKRLGPVSPFLVSRLVTAIRNLWLQRCRTQCDEMFNHPANSVHFPSSLQILRVRLLHALQGSACSRVLHALILLVIDHGPGCILSGPFDNRTPQHSAPSAFRSFCLRTLLLPTLELDHSKSLGSHCGLQGRRPPDPLLITTLWASQLRDGQARGSVPQPASPRCEGNLQ